VEFLKSAEIQYAPQQLLQQPKDSAEAPGKVARFAVLTDSTPLLRLNTGGEGGIRTLDTGVSPYNGLANRRLQPLGHLSGEVNRRDCNSLPRTSLFIWCTLARISRHAGEFRMQTLRRINLARSAMGFAKSVNVRSCSAF
jgi:hypothetical protein